MARIVRATPRKGLRRRSEIAEETRQTGYLVQDDRFEATALVSVLARTTDPTDAPLVRLLIEADDVTSLRESSRLMVDKVTTTPRSKLGEQLGQLSDDDMIRLSRALFVFLGLAGT